MLLLSGECAVVLGMWILIESLLLYTKWEGEGGHGGRLWNTASVLYLRAEWIGPHVRRLLIPAVRRLVDVALEADRGRWLV